MDSSSHSCNLYLLGNCIDVTVYHTGNLVGLHNILLEVIMAEVRCTYCRKEVGIEDGYCDERKDWFCNRDCHNVTLLRIAIVW